MKSIYLQLLDLKYEICELALATVTGTQGSAPQKPGSSALYGKKGLIAGTVGGGVVEQRVELLAMEAIRTKKSGHFRFNLANEISKKEEAICGGQISILIDANLNNYLDVFEQLRDIIEKRTKGVLITMVTLFSQEIVVINRYWMSNAFKPPIPEEFMERIGPEADDILSRADPYDYRELELAIPDKEPSSLFFLEPVFPPVQLIIAGAGHIGRALAHLAGRLGFEVTVIDDRAEFANSGNIPEADHILVNDIGEELRGIKKNRDTYIVIVTRSHKDDASALKSCIGSEIAYVGMIGSKNKIASMRNDFINNGWATAEQWDTIHSPVGIDIKSRTVEEIAISIAAQLILIRNSQ
jgi:xanthine dehydrogenase accessory factor